MKHTGFSLESRLRSLRRKQASYGTSRGLKPRAYKLGRKPSGLQRAGKKVKLREQINRPNRARFAAMGLLSVCEARLPGCWPNGRLTWAHGKKDRFLTMEERKYLVIRCCTVCHHELDDRMSHAEMLAFVQDVIARRELAA